MSSAGAILNLRDAADQPSAKQSSTERTESDTASSPGLTTDEIVAEEAMLVKGHYCAEDLTLAESPCIVEMVAETEPTHPVEDDAEGAPGMSDEWGIWGAWNFSGKGKKDKKKGKGRPVFEYSKSDETPAVEPVPEFTFAAEECPPAEEAPAEVLAEEVSAEEVPAEEVPAEEAPADVLAEELPAEEAPAEERAICYEKDAAYADAEPEPAPEPEPTPEAPPVEVQNDPWGFSTYKRKKKTKKARFATEIDFSSPPPPSPPHDPSEPDILAIDVSPIPRDGSLPVFEYQTFAQETKSDNTPCRRRGYHLADDVRWMECPKCRAELSAIAREMTASTPGWRNFS